ncbi:AAA family ATPase [Leminorella grimontii]|uniref:AAA family ATPase n=1 Tax=Leminorella grimontii TaxID=82981 RepID=UPI0032206217
MAKVIFLIGAAGSGKSTIGKLLASKLNYSYLDKDVVSNRFTGKLLVMQGHAPTDRDGCDFYKNEVMPLEYETLLHLAGENLKLGNSVVLDAPFLGYFSDPNFVKNSIAEYGWSQDVDANVLEVTVKPEVLKNRIITRNNARDAWKLENWDAFIQSILEKKCLWDGVNYIRFDNSGSNVDEALLYSYFK